jgi:uncharacterized membrane protein
MKLIPLFITGVTVLGFNIILQITYDIGEDSTQRLVMSGVLAIVVYEVSYYFHKRLSKK